MKEPVSPFLSLPLEICHIIYDELLVCKADSPRLLYHDRLGRHEKLFLNPQILRANKQINAEATSVLYKQNSFQIDLSTRVVKCAGGMYPGRHRAPNPPYLLRMHTRIPGIYFRRPGLIYPHCFQRLASIEIIISADSVWGSGRRCSFFSHVGELVLELLQILADDRTDQFSRTKKRLGLTVKKNWVPSFGGQGLFVLDRGDVRPMLAEPWGVGGNERQQFLDRMVPVIESLSRKRDISINEIQRRDYTTWGDEDDGEPRTVEVKQRQVPIGDIGSL